MREFRNQIILLLIFFLAALFISIHFYGEMTAAGVEKVPIHWNTMNEPDNFASPLIAVMIGPGAILLIVIAAALSVGRIKSESEIKAVKTIWIVVGALLTGVNWIALKAGSGYHEGALLDSGFLHLMMGLLFMVVGNTLAKIRPGYWIGVRVPLTMGNEEVWNRVHRKSGRLLVLSGLLILCGVFFAQYHWAWIFYLPLLISIVFIIFVIPRKVSRDVNGTERDHEE